ncbi:MAG: ubiquinone/menaquinone biosynthesis methyltransferase [bacterium]|nr:ubiquinone/menaquinone biosynthesis methyltransferase [bacterium]
MRISRIDHFAGRNTHVISQSMTNDTSRPVSRDSARIRGLFNAISHRYDLLNTLLTAGLDRRWRKQGVALFSPQVKRVLDIASGTGPLSLTWLEARDGNEVLATDFAPAMCRKGCVKLADKPGCLGFIVADALALPLPDNTFDGVMCGYGVRNFADLQRGLSEMARTLKPGGELLVLDFFPSRKPLTGRLIRFYMRRILPLVGGLISGEPKAYAYLPLSVDDFVTHEQFRAQLEELGFQDVRVREQSGGITSTIHARLAP